MGGRHIAADIAADGRAFSGWSPASELLAQLGGEVASALSAALDRVEALSRTGRIDRGSLLALRDEIACARRAGIMGQQVGRVASGTVQLKPERLDLPSLLKDALQQRGAEIARRGVELQPQLVAAEVLGDATLTWSLLQVLLDWSFEHARTAIALTLERPAWPPNVRLIASFGYAAGEHAARQPLDTISWRLLEQTAATLGLRVARADRAGRTAVTIEFPRTLADAIEGVSAIELDSAGDLAAGSKALVGSHVLVLTARRELRTLVRESLRPYGAMLDFVASVAEARAFCSAGMPHVLIHEAALDGDGFERLRRELQTEAPLLAFIEIGDEDQGFEIRKVAGRDTASLGCGAIVASLPSALLFELARGG